MGDEVDWSGGEQCTYRQAVSVSLSVGGLRTHGPPTRTPCRMLVWFWSVHESRTTVVRFFCLFVLFCCESVSVSCFLFSLAVGERGARRYPSVGSSGLMWSEGRNMNENTCVVITVSAPSVFMDCLSAFCPAPLHPPSQSTQVT